MTEQAEPTPGPWETSRHKAPWSPNRWTIREHEFPTYPYEGQLDAEWGVYPPLGECGPVALVAGEENARLITAAPELLKALEDAPFPSSMGSAAEHYERFYTWLKNVAQPAIDKAKGLAPSSAEQVPVTDPGMNNQDAA